MQRLEMCVDRRLWAGMVEQAVDVMMTSEVGDDRAGRRHEQYDTRRYFNVRSKADTSRLDLPHGNDN